MAAIVPWTPPAESAPTPMTSSAAELKSIDSNARTVQLAYGGGKLYQLHDNGQIWKFNGPNSSPRWSYLAGNASVHSIAASPKHLYKLLTNGELIRYTEATGKWETIKTGLNNVKNVIASEKSLYWILTNGQRGIAESDIDDPSPSYKELEDLYESSKAKASQYESEIAGLQGRHDADKKLIDQLQSDYEGAQAQNATLTAELKTARADAAAEAKKLQDQIAALQKSLAASQASEEKLSNALDAEKKKEHEEWKKFQQHDAADHKALDVAQDALKVSQAKNVELQGKLDELSKDVADKKEEIKVLEAGLADAKKHQQLAEAELAKHLTDDIGDDIVISGLEKVIEGLKKEIQGQEILIGVLKKQLAK